MGVNVKPSVRVTSCRFFTGIVTARNGPAIGMHDEISYDIELVAIDSDANVVILLNHFPKIRPSKTVEIAAAEVGWPVMAVDGPLGLMVHVPEWIDYTDHCEETP